MLMFKHIPLLLDMLYMFYAFHFGAIQCVKTHAECHPSNVYYTFPYVSYCKPMLNPLKHHARSLKYPWIYPRITS